MPEGVTKFTRPSGSVHELVWQHSERELSPMEQEVQVCFSEINSSNHCKTCRRKMQREKKLCRKGRLWRIGDKQFSYQELKMMAQYWEFMCQRTIPPKVKTEPCSDSEHTDSESE